MPAIGTFPIQKAIDENWPEIKEETWYRLAIVISAADRQEFHKIYALCNKKLEVNMAGPAQYAATYLQAPHLAQSSAASSSGSQIPPPPPPTQPPPPPPPLPRFSVMTANGIHGFEPDSVTLFRHGETIEEC